jgi:hypothetical protein
MYLINPLSPQKSLADLPFSTVSLTHLTNKANELRNNPLKPILVSLAKIIDDTGKIFASSTYNVGVFVFNNTYARCKNIAIKKFNQEASQSWNKTAFKTWAFIGMTLFLTFEFFHEGKISQKPPQFQPNYYFWLSGVVLVGVSIAAVKKYYSNKSSLAALFETLLLDLKKTFPGINQTGIDTAIEVLKKNLLLLPSGGHFIKTLDKQAWEKHLNEFKGYLQNNHLDAYKILQNVLNKKHITAKDVELWDSLLEKKSIITKYTAAFSYFHQIIKKWENMNFATLLSEFAANNNEKKFSSCWKKIQNKKTLEKSEADYFNSMIKMNYLTCCLYLKSLKETNTKKISDFDSSGLSKFKETLEELIPYVKDHTENSELFLTSQGCYLQLHNNLIEMARTVLDQTQYEDYFTPINIS